MSRIALGVGAFLCITAFVIYPDPSPRVDASDLACTVTFGLSTQAVPNKPSEGSGVVTCDDGPSLRVHIAARGTGLDDATSMVGGASGTFTRVYSVAEVLGTFTDADVARTGTDDAQILSKDRVTLTLSGGNGHADLGSGVSEFVLTRAR